MRRSVPLILAAVMLVSLAACSIEPEASVSPSVSPSPSASQTPAAPGKTQNEIFGLAWDSTEQFNPILVKNKYNRELTPLVYESLFALDKSFEPVCALCQSYTVSGLVYTLSLRQGVVFHDGSAFTAKDAAYSLELARTEASAYAAHLKKVASVRATGPYVLEITLSAPQARLPALLDIPVIKDGSAGQSFPPGTGPYAPKITADDALLLENTRWWQKKALPIKRIDLVTGKDSGMLIYNFEADLIGLLSVDSTGTNPIGLRGDCEAWEYPTSIMQYIGFNTKRSPLNDPAVRRAIGFAVDRQSITANVMLGRAVKSALPVPPSSPLFSADLDGQYGYNLSRLSSLLYEAGISDSDSDGVLDYHAGRHRAPLSLTLIVNSENAFKTKAAYQIGESLKQVGVTLTVRELKWSDYQKALSGGDFDLYYGETMLSADFSLDFLLHTRTGGQGALNYGNYSSAQTDSLLAAYSQTGAAREAYALYSDMAQQAPIVPVLFKMSSVYTHRGQLRGVSSVQNNLYYGIDGWTVAE